MINPIPEKLGQVFDSAFHLTVPRYQRDYKWGKGEATEFWEDLQSYFNEKTDSLFLGSLIFDISHEKNKRHQIIDGQQRITTIMILLIACRQLAKKINEHKIATRIQDKICFEDETTGKFLGTRLKPSKAIADVFEFICHDEWDGEFPDKIEKQFVKRQSNKLKPLYNYFYSEIENFNQTDLSILLDTLYNSYVIRIDIKNELEAFKIFERTNARGIDLEASDLLKNHLFASIDNNQEVQDTWENIRELSDGTLLKMIKYFYVSKKGRVTKSVLYKKLKLLSNEITATSLLNELHSFSRFFNAIKNPDSDRLKYYFTENELETLVQDQEYFDDIYFSIAALHLFKITQTYPLIYAALECYKRSGLSVDKKHNKKIVRLFKKLENYHYINNGICDRVGNEVEALYADFSNKYSSSNDFLKITQELDKELEKKKASKEEFVSRFMEDLDYSSKKNLIHYTFDRLNNHGLSAGQRLKIYNPDQRVIRKSYNIEHFYPQSEKANTQSLDKDIIDNIGNLLSINFRTNSSLGSVSPSEKAKKLRNELSRDIENYSYVSEFLDKYESDFDDWNEQKITQRANDLANDAWSKVA